jgi:hypothetical protein
MASLVSVTCKACHNEAEVQIGSTQVAIERRCDTCGAGTYLPRCRPYGKNGAMSEAELRDYVCNRASDWHAGEQHFGDAEWRIIDHVVSRCECGGHLVPDWADLQPPLRCPACRSTDIVTIESDALLD